MIVGVQTVSVGKPRGLSNGLQPSKWIETRSGYR
jgi:hypothetical protein